MPDMRTVLQMLTGLDDDTKLGRYISWDDYYRLLSSSSTGVNMNPDIARWIVDRYNAWQKKHLDDEDVSLENEDWKKEVEEEAFGRLQEVIQLGNVLRGDHQRVDGKLDLIMRSIQVPEGVYKIILSKSKTA